MSTFTNAESYIEALYIGYFGRAGDPAGMEYWVGRFDSGMSLAAIAASFSVQTEATNKYAFLANPLLDDANHDNAAAFINTVFEDLFNRAENATVDPVGFNYWLGRIVAAASNPQAIGQIIEDIISGAVGTDDATLQNKVLVGDFFTNEMAATNTPYAGGAIALSTTIIADTTSNPSTVTTEDNAVTAFIGSNVIGSLRYLTTGADLVNGYTNVFGSFTTFFYDGVGPTLNSNDVISNVTNLFLTDQYGNGFDIIPAGAQLSNITNVSLMTAGAAGASGTPFDTSGITGVQTLTVTSAGDFVDYVKGGPATAITINQNSHGVDAGVTVSGGSTVTVTSYGGTDVIVGNQNIGSVPSAADLPTGAVMVTESGSGSADVHVMGGTSVTVNMTSPSSQGYIEIGNTSDNTGNFLGSAAAATDPTGPIVVTDAAQYGGDISFSNNADIIIYGGTTVNVTAAGEKVVIGDAYVYNPANQPTGDVTVSNIAPQIWTDATYNAGISQQEDVYVSGGANVSVTTNTGSVFVGDYLAADTPDFGTDQAGALNVAGTAALAGTQPTGSVTIVDTASQDYTSIGVYGGTDVTINTPTTVSAADIQVGIIDTAVPGGQNSVVLAPTGNITIYDNAAKTWAGTDQASATAPYTYTTGTNAYVDEFIGYDYPGTNYFYAGEKLTLTIDSDVNNASTTYHYTVTAADIASPALLAADLTAAIAGSGDTFYNNGDEIYFYYYNGYSDTYTYDWTISGSTGLSGPVGDAGIGHQIDVVGGTNVSVTTNTASVVVGGDTLNYAGTAVLAGENPSGTVTIVDTATAEDYYAGGTELGSQSDSTVTVYGGTNVSVTASGMDIFIGADTGGATPVVVAPSGTVTVTDMVVETLPYDGGYLTAFDEYIDILGGTTINVTTNAGSVYIGEDGATPTAGSEPTGTVMVVDQSTGNVEVYGGTDVTATSWGGYIQVGDGANPANSALTNPTGTVTATMTAIETGWLYDTSVVVEGGTAVTVNTTGGNVYVGTDGAGFGNTPVTGAVVINDTFGGITQDDIGVMGGTTVNITTSASTNNAIDVGNPTLVPPFGAAQNVGGTALLTTGDGSTADDPTGNVAIYDATVNGSTTTYGTESFSVVTNGAASVSVTGGAGSTNVIGDVQSELLTATDLAAGTATLANVSLTGVVGTTIIGSDALSSLTINNSGASLTADIYDDTANSALTLNLASDKGTVTVNDLAQPGFAGTTPYIGSVVVNSTDTGTGNANVLTLDLPQATSVTFNVSPSTAGLPGLTLVNGVDLTAVQTINVTGTGGLDLGNLSGNTALSFITSTNSNGVKVQITGTTTSFNASAGNNSVTVDTTASAFGIGNQVGSGTGTLELTNLAADYLPIFDPTGPIYNYVSGFNSLFVGTATDSGGTDVAAASGTYNAAGFANVGIGAIGIDTTVGGGNITFSNVASGINLILRGDPFTDLAAHTVTVTPASGTTNTLGLTLGRDVQSFNNAPTTGIDFTDGGHNTVVISGDSTLNVSSLGTGTGTNTVTVNDTDTPNSGLHTINISGDEALTLNLTGTIGTGGVTAITVAAADTKAVNVVGVTDLSAHGTTFTGGGGMLTAQGNLVSGNANTANDVFTTGAGGGTYTIGYGGAGGLNDTMTSVNPNGSEVIKLGASTGVTDKLIVPDASGGLGVAVTAVNGFVATVAKTSDVIQFNSIKNELAPNVTYTSTSGLGPTDTYTASNGVLTYTSNNGPISLDAEVADVQSIVNTASNQVAMFVNGGITFVIASDTGATSYESDAELTLVGVSAAQIAGGSYPGFIYNTPPALNAVEMNNVALAANTTVTTLGFTQNDAGYAYALMDAPGTASANASVTTFNSLAASGSVLIGNDGTGPGDHLGSIVINQVGTAGNDGLLIGLDAFSPNTVIMDKLTVSNDADLTLSNNFGGNDTVTSLVDATNTVTSISIVDGAIAGGEITIGGITDTALKTIDAHSFSGDLTLTASQAGLTITGSTGGFTLIAGGAGDTITDGTDAHPANTGDAISILAGGIGDHISVIGGDSVHIGAAGIGDTITVADETGTAYVTGNGDSFSSHLSTQLGANDTINVGDASNHATVHTWLGADSTVNLAVSSSADIHLLGDTAGASLTNMTVVNGMANSGIDLRLHFNDTLANGSATTVTAEAWAAGGNAANSQVNEASATSLANALNIAANQALWIDQTQGSGDNTTIVNQNTTTAALDLNAHTGLVDWFQYGGNTYIVEAVNSTGTAATHAGLATSDIVVELTGLVDMSHVSTHFA